MWIPFHAYENDVLFHLNNGFVQIFKNNRWVQSAVNFKCKAITVVNSQF